MPQSMLNAARKEGRLFANCSSADRPIACFFLVVRSFLARLSLVTHSPFTHSFPLAVAHPPAKYFRITCVDDFHFRFKYIRAAYARGTAYAFENKIESRKLLQNQMHGPRSEKRGPMESNTCTPSGVGRGRGGGGLPPYYFCAMARARAGGSSSHFDQSEQYCTVRPQDGR